MKLWKNKTTNSYIVETGVGLYELEPLLENGVLKSFSLENKNDLEGPFEVKEDLVLDYISTV